jgi:release factor glutamine methyltransferase
MNQPSIQEPINPLFASYIERYAPKIALLPDKPEESIENTLRALWLCAAGIYVSVVRAQEIFLPELSEEQKTALLTLIEKRVSGIPLAHLTGKQWFMGLEFRCSPQALIPRKETELLGNAALTIIKERLSRTNGPARVLDVCTGSGNLACALAVYAQEAEVYASDLSEDAVKLARENAEEYKFGKRFDARSGDLFNPFPDNEFSGFFNLIVCNPPYITSGKVSSLPGEIVRYEPKLAFDAGPLGLAIITRLINEAPKYLAAQGWLAFEIGLGQGPFILQRVNKNGRFKNIETIADANGEIRGIVAQRID